MRLWILLLVFLAPLPAQAMNYPLVMVTTFSVLGDFVKVVGKEKVEVLSLVEADQSPHDYKPRPLDQRSVDRSDLLIANGLGMEGWLAPLLQGSKESVKVVNASTGVQARYGTGGGIDPHAWLDVGNAMIYVQNIRDALVGIDPLNADFYKANAEGYLLQLKKLDHSIKLQMGRLPEDNRAFVVNHDAFAYFAAAYGLTAIPVQGLQPEKTASASDHPEALTLIKKKRVTVFFSENVDRPRVLEGMIALAGKGKIAGRLYSDAISKDEAGSGYMVMMKHNADTVFNALNR